MADNYSGASLSVSIGPASIIEARTYGDYAAVAIEDYSGQGYITTALSLPREPQLRMAIAGKLARAFDALAREAAGAMIGAPLPDGVDYVGTVDDFLNLVDPAEGSPDPVQDPGDHYVRPAVA